MAMRIIKKNTIGEQENRIYLIRKGDDIGEQFATKKQLAYLKVRLQNDKEVSILNQFDPLVGVICIERLEVSESKRLEGARKAGFEIHPALKDQEVETLAVVNAGVEPEECIAFAEGLALSNYQFLKYFTKDKSPTNKLVEIQIEDKGLSDRQVDNLNNLVKAVYLTRDLVNEPLSYLTAVQLAAEIEKMGTEAGFSVEVFNKKKIESLKMGGLLAVNKGSLDPPTFSILTWKPLDAVNKRPIVLVGKGWYTILAD